MWGTCYECHTVGNVHPLVSTDPKRQRCHWFVRCLQDRESLRAELSSSGHTNIHVPKEDA